MVEHPCNGCIWLGKNTSGEAGCIFHQQLAINRCIKYAKK